MDTTRKRLQNWHDKEILLQRLELVAESEDLTRTGRKIRKIREAFQRIGPVDQVMDPILEMRWIRSHQYFLDRRSLDMLRGSKNLEAIKEHQIRQLQASVDLLQHSLAQGEVVLATMKSSLPHEEDGSLLAKMDAQCQNTRQSLERLKAELEHVKTHDVSMVCSLPTSLR
ncbi:MAG: hypothetical protein HQL73_13190 [Magnetococcales bacterium]|nr:hypothetical protein [Magnetococcales bacterium]